MDRIKKKSVFITSTGRTGTQFLAKVMSEMINDSVSLHEPGTPWISKPEEWKDELEMFGLYHLTLGQIKPSHCMFKLSAERIRGKVSDDMARKYIYDMRYKLTKKLKNDIYIESSGHVYGLVDLLDDMFENCKFIFIVRDPRAWVRSAINTLEYIMYGILDPDFLRLSLKAKELKNDPYYEKWDSMTKFERYCWFYNKMNEFVISKMEGKDNFKVLKFEDLFKNDDVFEDMLKFASKFESNNINKGYSFNPELLKKKVHSNAKKRKEDSWENWSSEKAKILEKHCGSWMHKFGYGNEEKWLEKIENKRSQFD